MRWEHLRAILWLRWRLRLNRWRRDGLLNAIVMMAIVVITLIGSLLAFFVAAVAGIFQLGETEPDHLLLIWDGLVIAFLLFWMIDLVTELQRSESLSLDKLLHLPISLTGTFLLNYLTSLVSFPLIVFLPVAAGLIVAMVIVKGPAALMMVPLLVGFVLMVTGVTYHFRGWLASLMVNKRRRRTIIAMVTMGFVLLSLVPTVLNRSVFQPRRDQARQERRRQAQQQPETQQSGATDQSEHEKNVTARKQELAGHYETAVVVNLVLPVGWLPYGARASAQGHVLPGLLGSLGAILIGALSLWRSYQTTLRFYIGGYQSGKPRTGRPKTTETGPLQAKPTRAARLLETKLSFVSEHANAVALANLRSLSRAPEAKMMLLTPVILIAVFGSMLFSGRGSAFPIAWRPLLGIGAIGMTMLGFAQLLQNQFGFDRHGFRVYVLTPAPRSDVLLGKNLSVAPFGLGMSLISLTALQVALPMQISHFLATLVQVVLIFALFCLAGNLVSIIAPTAIKAGSLNAAKPKIVTVLIQFACMSLFALALTPALILCGVDLLLAHLGWRGIVPVYLILSLLEAGFVLWLYQTVLGLQGRLLQQRERRILDTVTAQVE